jgi:hypothetical protein
MGGIQFIPNKSSGSGFKLYSNNHIVKLGVLQKGVFR